MTQDAAAKIIPPAVQALDDIQSSAIALRCSDIHFEPVNGGGRVRFRCDGVLGRERALPPDVFAQVISRVKVLAGMDIAERRLPQDGRYDITSGGRSVEARTSTMPTIAGEKIVIRLLDYRGRPPAIRELGMPPGLADAFERTVQAATGFIVVTGPTGSGKTTTLYASLTARNLQRDNVCTVEDPVEIRIPGLVQVQINAKAGVTFASAVRGFMRQDPDAIMIGELRDGETATVAAAASLSGVLVLTTMHASDAAAAIERLCELGVSRQTLSVALTAIVSQRLIPRRDGAGRAAIFECLFVEPEMRALIAAGANHRALRELAVSRGMQTLQQHGEALAARGDIDAAELLRTVRGL